jgi:hypothetical protein
MDARIIEHITARADAAAAAEADVELAEAFIEAFNARDESTLGALSADPQVIATELFDTTDVATYFAWFDAYDWRWAEPECAVDVDLVVCHVRVRNKLTDAGGVERTDIVRFSTADGLIEDIRIVENDGEYSTRALEPFIEWVAAAYPEDLRAMWNFEPGCCSANRNETTIPLFASHLDEWTSGIERPAPAHRALLDAQAAGDVETSRNLLAPDATVDLLWATSVDDLPGLSALLSGLEWSWNVQSCSVSRDEPDPVRTGISCVATPTWRLANRDIDVPSTIVDFEFTSAGIASVSTGTWFERSAAGLAPLFDWIRTAHPDEAASLLAERDGTTAPVLSDAAVGQLLELVGEYLADAGG